MKKALIYPVTKDVISILRHHKMLRNYDEIYGVCLTSESRPEDISFIDNGKKIGIQCKDNLSDILAVVDDILFAEVLSDDYVNEYFLPVYEKCKSGKINIGFLFPVKTELEIKVKELCRDKNMQYISINEKYCIRKGNKMLNINTPVIFVCGTAKDTDKFELQLLLREMLIRDSYNVSQVGTKYFSNLFDFHAIPDFIFENTISDDEKIIEFNNYIKRIEENETPDVILIGIPGGTVKDTEWYTQEFAVIADEIATAVKPDYVFLCIYENDYSVEYLEELIPKINARYDFEINQIAVSNTYFDFVKTKENGIKEILKLPFLLVNEKCSKKEEVEYAGLFSIYEEFNTIYRKMIRELSEYAENNKI